MYFDFGLFKQPKRKLLFVSLVLSLRCLRSFVLREWLQ